MTQIFVLTLLYIQLFLSRHTIIRKLPCVVSCRLVEQANKAGEEEKYFMDVMMPTFWLLFFLCINYSCGFSFHFTLRKGRKRSLQIVFHGSLIELKLVNYIRYDKMPADVSNLSYVLRLFGAAQFVKIKALIKSTSFVKNEVRS